MWPPIRWSETPGAISSVASVESDPLREHRPHHFDHVLGREGQAEELVRHVPPGAVRHLVVLEMEPGVREGAEAARVVVVHVGDDDLLHPSRLHAHEGQAFRWLLKDPPLPAGRLLAGEAGVDDEGAVRARHEPHVVVEVAGGLVASPPMKFWAAVRSWLP